MARLRKKGQAGYKKNYISRDKAIKRLQLTIKDFRRLCILKGVYPVEPRKPGKISKSSKKKTYYLSSDIKYLSNEPLIWKFWEFKSFLKKLGHCKAKGEFDRLNALARNKPQLRLDQVLRDRYPKFEDALRDLDDSLCMCFLYASLTKSDSLPEQVINYSRRLTLEFLHYVIESRSLRKVFISIKGIYYQTNIQGQTVTFIVPHKFSLAERSDVDYSVMRTFTEFYINLLGFVNFRLFQSLNLYYPPKLNIDRKCKESSDLKYTEGNEFLDRAWEHIASLNRPLLRSKRDPIESKEESLEFFDEDQDELGYHKLMKFQKLFEGQKVFLSREVPRDSLTFVIRSFGGQISWTKTDSIDSTFDEDDETITYQIVDREKVNKKYLNRQYVQPQWVYDSVNAGRLLPAEDYFPGVKLPPHLSPFVEKKEGEYIPPEQVALETTGRLKVGSAEPVDEEVESSDDDDDEEDEEDQNEDAKANQNLKPEPMEEDDNDDESEEEEKEDKLAKMQVKSGQVKKENLKLKQAKERQEERKMAEMMIPKKKKRLYNKIVKAQRSKRGEVVKLTKKREQIDLANLRQKGKSKVKSN